MKKRGVKIAFFIFFSLILVLPLVYSFMQLNSKIALKGAVELSEKPEFGSASWFGGEFQANYEKFVNDNIGFRPIFVRIRNQIAYTVFGKAKAAGVIEGKNNCLYERNYIKAYNGTDFVGLDSIKRNVALLKSLQDSLQNLGKTFLVCLAPGKGSFYPEYFPDKFVLPKTDTTNYNFYSKYLSEFGVNNLDFNRWFLQMKDTSQYILYPKYGIHWSYYGMLLASDSLIHHVENMRNEDLPNLIIGDYWVTRNLERMDYDIADGMNLLWQLSSEPMCYPENEWESAEGKSQPKVILVGDSFYWSMFQLGLWAKSFSAGGFWFYNRQIYPESFEQTLLTNDIDYWEAIENNDVFILLVTEANLPKFPWGFTKKALDSFHPDYKKIVSKKKVKIVSSKNDLQTHIRNIKANENWMKDIRRKSKEMNITIDSMLILDATWMMEYKKSQEKN
jgi:hypothetical protein